MNDIKNLHPRAVCCLGSSINIALVNEGITPIKRVYQAWGGSGDSGWPDCDGDFIMTRLLNSRSNPEFEFDSAGNQTCIDARRQTLEFTVGVCRKPEAAEGRMICDILGSCPACGVEPEPATCLHGGDSCECSLGAAQTWTDHAWRLGQIFSILDFRLMDPFCTCMKQCYPIKKAPNATLEDMDTGEEGRWAFIRGTVSVDLIG